MQPVIFDLEGTLVDFQWELAAAERRARNCLADLGYDPAAFESATYAELYNEAIRTAPEVDVEPSEVRRRLDAIYDDFDADALDRWSLRPDAREALDALDRRGLVTNVGRTATDALLERTGLDFDVVLTRTDVERLKPDPAGLERASETLGGRPLFVGDSVTDVRAGAKAGIPVAIIGGGESGSSEIDAAEPAHRIDSLSAVPELVGENAP